MNRLHSYSYLHFNTSTHVYILSLYIQEPLGAFDSSVTSIPVY